MYLLLIFLLLLCLHLFCLIFHLVYHSTALIGSLYLFCFPLFAVIIMCAKKDTVRRIMITAYKMGMVQTGEFVFITVELTTG